MSINIYVSVSEFILNRGEMYQSKFQAFDLSRGNHTASSATWN